MNGLEIMLLISLVFMTCYAFFLAYLVDKRNLEVKKLENEIKKLKHHIEVEELE